MIMFIEGGGKLQKWTKMCFFFSKAMGTIHKDLLFCTSNSNEGGGDS